VLGLLGVALLITLGIVRPTSVSTGPDQVALHYKDGAFSSRRFADCVSPSQRVWDGPGDRHFVYPSSQTNFVFDQGDSDGAPITFVTKDGIEMQVEGVANFLLNTSCEPIKIGGTTYNGGGRQGFPELIGNRAEESGGGEEGGYRGGRCN